MATATGLHTRITAAILGKQLFKPGDTLIIGLSGGADSTALLDLLATLPAFPLCLVAAHLNHCLRGADADADEQFCRELAASYKIPFESRRVDVQAVAAAESLNLEDAGRRARISFFDDLMVTWQAAAVVLAHHADDQAETVLMRLLRGSGMTGLAGIPVRNGRGYIRPLLDISRREIEAYLVERHMSWREDSSNLDTSMLRNSIRHELLPLLEQYNPAIRNALATSAGILSQEDALLEALTMEAAGQVCCLSESSATCDISLLKSHPIALQRRILRLMLSRLAGNLEHVTHRHLENILQILDSGRPNLRLSLPQGLVAVREYNTLAIEVQDSSDPEAMEIAIPGPGCYRLPDGSLLRIESAPPPVEPTGTPGVVYFDTDRLPFPWYVRTFRPGDRIQPFGMSGRKKVKDIFIDEKIPQSQRRRIPLLFCGCELIWIVGLRTSQLGRVDSLSSGIVSAFSSPPAASGAVN
ncbi:MAG: tRNA lysidine(34) synthetase TilS [Desulfobacteraceae bacterium]|nr:tRNA lysidine(34) synthetase TilS [Desulfobacteraceae bacterium]